MGNTQGKGGNYTEAVLCGQRLKQLQADHVSPNLGSLQASFNLLSDLPPRFVELKGLTSLDLSFNQFSIFPHEIFALKNLKVLSFVGNSLSEIPKEVSKLTALTTLRLGMNAFTKFPVHVLSMVSLSTLHLNNNLLCNLNPFDRLNSTVRAPIATLNLEHNLLEDLSNNICFLSSLSVLRLTHNQLLFLPETLGRLSHLSSLSLSFNKLMALPRSLSNLPKLAFLDCSYNQLTAIPPEWYAVSESFDDDALLEHEFEIENGNKNNEAVAIPFALPSITESDIRDDDRGSGSSNGESTPFEVPLKDNDRSQSHPSIASASALSRARTRNSIDDPTRMKRTGVFGRLHKHDHVPEAFQALTELYLNSNEIIALPHRFFMVMVSLRNLSLSNNEIGKLPPLDPTVSYQFSNLYFAYNKISVFPEEFTKVKTLSVIDVSFNMLTKLPDISRMSNLKVFLAAYNPLYVLPIVFPPSLIELNLTGCRLSDPPRGKLKELRVLHLGVNKLHELPDDVLASPSLDSIDISDNKFKTFPQLIKMMRTKAETNGTDLRIDHNPAIMEKMNSIVNISTLEYCDIGLGDMQGKRKTMEDKILIGNIKFEREGALNSFDIVGLFDGHGGKRVAEILAGTTRSILHEQLSLFPPMEALKKTFPLLTKSIKTKLGAAIREKVGSTALVLLLNEHCCYVANTGDTRAVASKDLTLSSLEDLTTNEESRQVHVRISVDHRPLEITEHNRVTSLGGFVSENGRVNGILGVSRSFGDFFLTPLITDSPFVVTFPLVDPETYSKVSSSGSREKRTKRRRRHSESFNSAISEKNEKSEKSKRNERREKKDKDEKNEKNEKTDKNDKTEKTEKSEKKPKREKSERKKQKSASPQMMPIKSRSISPLFFDGNGAFNYDPEFIKEKDGGVAILDGQCDFIIVACDGVWDVISDELAIHVVRESLFVRRESTHEAAVRLRTLAFVVGSTDNISVVVILTPFGKKKLLSLAVSKTEHKEKEINPSHHEMKSDNGEYISEGEISSEETPKAEAFLDPSLAFHGRGSLDFGSQRSGLTFEQMKERLREQKDKRSKKKEKKAKKDKENSEKEKKTKK